MDLTKDFERWNPMEKDYSNPEFNSYDIGPGVNFNSCIYSKQNKGINGNGEQNCYIVLKNVPKCMSKHAVFNLCCQFGGVIDVRHSKKNKLFFADVISFADMEAILRGIQRNSFGIVGFVGKPANEKEEEKFKELSKQIGKFRSEPFVYENDIELERRNIHVLPYKPKRPVLTDKSIISQDNYKNESFKVNDPFQQFVISHEAFVLKDVAKIKYKGNYGNSTYISGRAFRNTAEIQSNYLQSKLNLVSNNYNKIIDIYTKNYAKEIVCAEKFFHSCENCNLYSDVKCFQCSSRFCNLKCLKTKWYVHKRNCGKQKCHSFSTQETFSRSIPKLSNKFIVKADQTNKLLIPTDGSKVCITSIINSNMVYVRSKEKKIDEYYTTIINKIHKVCKTQKKLSNIPKVGEVVVAKFGEQYNRALVLNNQNKSRIKLVYIDYGNLICKNYLELYNFSKSLKNLPQFIRLVILKNVPGFYMTVELRDFLYYYLNDINLKIVFNPEKDKMQGYNIDNVELIDYNTSRNLNAALIKIGYALPNQNNLTITMDYLERYSPPMGENIEMVVMDDSFLHFGYLSCTSLEYGLEIQRFNKDIQTYGEFVLEENEYTPRINEMCVAKYSVDNKWYRGCCIDVVGDGHPTILFVDYGNLEMVPIKMIRKYPKQFTFPIYTNEFEIIEFSENFGKSVQNHLQKSKIIKCNYIKKVEDGFYKLSLSNLLNK